MKVKKFNQINESEFYKFELDNKVYYGVKKSVGDYDIYDGYGNPLDQFTFPRNDKDHIQDDNFQEIEYKDFPKEVVDAINDNREELTDQFLDNSYYITFHKYYEFSIDGVSYYAMVNIKDEREIFIENGENVDISILNNAPSDTNIKEIKPNDLPKSIKDILKERINDAADNGQEIVDSIKQEDDMLKPKEKTYADMNQKELNDLINQSIDSGDFATAHEISQFMGESKVFRFKG